MGQRVEEEELERKKDVLRTIYTSLVCVCVTVCILYIYERVSAYVGVRIHSQHACTFRQSGYSG